MQNVPGRLSKDSRPFLKCECSFFKIVKVDIKKAGTARKDPLRSLLYIYVNDSGNLIKQYPELS